MVMQSAVTVIFIEDLQCLFDCLCDLNQGQGASQQAMTNARTLSLFLGLNKLLVVFGHWRQNLVAAYCLKKAQKGCCSELKQTPKHTGLFHHTNFLTESIQPIPALLIILPLPTW